MTTFDTAIAADPATIVAIAQDVFAALVDDGEVLVVGTDAPSSWTAPVAAWVDMTTDGVPGGVRTRVLAERPDADALVRVLLREEPDAEVTQEDLVDAFGEIANVVGGNLKALLPELARLTLPVVSEGQPEDPGVELVQAPIGWRGATLVVSLWHLA